MGVFFIVNKNMNKFKLATPKGFRDFLPADAIKRNYLRDKIRQVFERWGYDPLETPTLEFSELFKGLIGEDEKLFFKFKDAGGREVALRYDQTVPASRVVAQYNIPMPFRRYQIQSAFRAEKPQRGRYREFLQCDADIWGIPSPIADAEVIALSLTIYQELGFKKAIARVNDRALFKDLPYEAIVAIDKLKKVGEEAVIKEMKNKGISQGMAKRYLNRVINLKPNETILAIFSLLEKYGFDKDWYIFDPTTARSFAYSDGPIWEIEIPEYTAGSVLGGERYNSLTGKISGKNVTGTGFGLGFDRTLEATEQLGLLPTSKTTTQVLVTVFNSELVDKSIEVTTKLRAVGINTEIWLEPEDKLDKQLKYADQKGIPFTIIIGPEESEAQQVILKDMQSQSQQKVTIDQLLQKFK